MAVVYAILVLAVVFGIPPVLGPGAPGAPERPANPPNSGPRLWLTTSTREGRWSNCTIQVWGPWRWLAASRPLDHLASLTQTPPAQPVGHGPARRISGTAGPFS